MTGGARRLGVSWHHAYIPSLAAFHAGRPRGRPDRLCLERESQYDQRNRWQNAADDRDLAGRQASARHHPVTRRNAALRLRQRRECGAGDRSSDRKADRRFALRRGPRDIRLVARRHLAVRLERARCRGHRDRRAGAQGRVPGRRRGGAGRDGGQPRRTLRGIDRGNRQCAALDRHRDAEAGRRDPRSTIVRATPNSPPTARRCG